MQLRIIKSLKEYTLYLIEASGQSIGDHLMDHLTFNN